MNRFLAFSLVSLTLALPLSAQTSKPVLVELFASQNCPACPKAHRTMRTLSENRSDVFVLTWSVNYWDYLGDPDPMALPKAKERQAAYADNLSLRAPYTPQSVYDGIKQCPGTKMAAVEDNIRKRQTEPRTASPVIEQTDTGIVIRGAADTGLDVTLVEYLSGGRNQTDMVNPVTRTQTLARWTGEPEAIPLDCPTSCAVLLHKPNYGEIITFKLLEQAD